VAQAEFRPEAATETTTVVAQLAAMVQTLRDAGYPVLGRTLFCSATAPDQDAPTVAQAVVLGAEQFHLVTKGVVVEPIARLRTAETIRACRRQDWRRPGGDVISVRPQKPATRRPTGCGRRHRN
jgi:hypothetical protein